MSSDLPLEVIIERKCCRWASKTYGIKTIKFTGEIGRQDRLFIIPPYGIIVFVEFKRQGEKLRPIQEFRMDELRKLGCNVAWVDRFDKFKELIEGYIHAATKSTPIPGIGYRVPT